MSKQFASIQPAMLIEIRRLLDAGQQGEALEMISRLEAGRDLSEDDTTLHRLLSLKSIAIYNNAEFAEALDLARKTLRAVIGTAQNELIAELQSTCARCLIELGQVSDAEHTYRDLVSTYRRLDDTINVIRVLNRLSRIHFIRGNFDRAVSVLIEAEEHARRVNSDRQLAMIQGNLGTIFNLTGEFNKAVDYLTDSVTSNRRLKNDLNLCRAKLSLAFALMHLKRYEAAESALDTAQQLAVAGDHKPEIAMSHQYRAKMALLQDNPTTARSEALTALSFVSKGCAEDSQINRLLAAAELRLENLDAAAKACNYALTVARSVGEKVEEAACLRIKAEIAYLNQAAQQVVADMLDQAIAILQASGSQYELAQTWAVKSRVDKNHASAREFNRRSYGILTMLGLSDRADISGKTAANPNDVVLVGEHPEFRRVVEDAAISAESDISVLLLGQTGAGKDQIAKKIHYNSTRRNGPFVIVNCGAIPRELAETEFFGHEKGAFTNASGVKQGLMEAARGGTLFLNEVGELPLTMQVKLLSALDEKKFYRVGGTTPRTVDFRIIAATNVDLHEAVEKGTFRADLFYRLNVMTINVPRLAERGEDAFRLFEHFLAESGLNLQALAPEVREELRAEICAYHWPGNIRELKNYVDRYIVTERRDVPAICRRIRQKLANETRKAAGDLTAERVDLNQELANYEANLIKRALALCDGVKRGAAEYLGVPESTLRSKLKKLGINAA